MRYLKIAFGLVVVVGVLTAMASSAMARPIWVHCVKGEGWMAKCGKAGTGWQTKAITVAETSEVTSSGTLELEDSLAPGGGTAMECTETNVGTTGAEGSGSIKGITATSCKFIKAGECETSKPITFKTINLGWSLLLEEVTNKSGETELRDRITSLTSKPPGWAVECTVKGIFKITDTCEGNSSTKVRENRANGTVEGVFEEESPLAKCSVGGAGAGHVRGTLIFKLRSAESAFWPLALVLKT